MVSRGTITSKCILIIIGCPYGVLVKCVAMYSPFSENLPKVIPYLSVSICPIHKLDINNKTNIIIFFMIYVKMVLNLNGYKHLLVFEYFVQNVLNRYIFFRNSFNNSDLFDMLENLLLPIVSL